MREIAQQFAGRGRVWKTTVAAATSDRVRHIGRLELLGLLQGKGKGRAKWDDPYKVLQARRYVEQSAEHLLDFSPLRGSAKSDIEAVVAHIFKKA